MFRSELKAARGQLEVCVALVRNLAFFCEFARNPEEYREQHQGKVCVVPATIIEAAQFFQESARRKHMKIHLHDRETQFKIHFDKDLLRQVFMNLLDNGVKYGNSHSDIAVRSHIQKTTDNLIMEVIGSSPPVPRENWEKFFEAGFRSENARQIVASGTGLGLYICRLILGLYGGTISYRDRPNIPETTFTLTVPGAWT